MGGQFTMSVSKISALMQGLEFFGLTSEELFQTEAIDLSSVSSPDHRLTAGQVNTIMEGLGRITGIEEIGLLLGERLSRGFSSIVGYILMNCANLGTAAVKYCEYETVVDGTGRMKLHEEGEQVELRSTVLDAALRNNRIYIDLKLAGTYTYINMLTGRRIPLCEVRFTCDMPRSAAEYERVFQCPVRFQSDNDALVLRREDLSIPLIGPNPALLEPFEKIARDARSGLRLQDHSPYTAQVLRLLLDHMREVLLPSRQSRNSSRSAYEACRIICGRKGPPTWSYCERLAKEWLRITCTEPVYP